MVLDFTTSVSGSSFNYFFFGLVLAPLLSLSIDLYTQDRMGCQEVDKEKK